MSRPDPCGSGHTRSSASRSAVLLPSTSPVLLRITVPKHPRHLDTSTPRHLDTSPTYLTGEVLPRSPTFFVVARIRSALCALRDRDHGSHGFYQDNRLPGDHVLTKPLSAKRCGQTGNTRFPVGIIIIANVAPSEL